MTRTVPASRPLAVALLLVPRLVATEPPGAPPEAAPLTLNATVGAGGEYTDNFFRTASRSRSSFRQTVTPDVKLELGGPLHRGSVRYRPTLAYSTLGAEVEHFHALDASGSYEVTPSFSVSLSEQFSRSDNPTVTDPNTLRTGRTVTDQNVAGLTLPYRSDGWSLTPRASWRLVRNEGEGAVPGERSDALTLGADGFSGETWRTGASRQFGQRSQGSLDGSYTVRRPERRDEFSIREVGLETRYQPWETATVSGRLGYQDTDVAEGSGTRGLVHSGQASYAGAQVNVAVNSELSIRESFTEAEDAGLLRSQSSGASVTYQAADGVVLSATGRWSRNEFLESQRRRTDTVLTWSLSATSRLSRTLTLSAAWEHTRRSSSQPRGDLSVNTLRLELLIDWR